MFLVLFFYTGTADVLAQKNSKVPNACDELFSRISDTENSDSPFYNEPLNHIDLLIAFYGKRNCSPAWYSPADSFALYSLLFKILPQQGFVPVSLHTDKIELLYTEAETIYLPVGLYDFTETNTFDIYLTDAAFTYAVELCQTIAGAELMQLPFMLNEALEKKQFPAFFDNLKKGIWTPEQTERPAAIVPADNVKPVQKAINDSTLFKLVASIATPSKKVLLFGSPAYLPDLIGDFYRRNDFNLAWQTGGNLNTSTIEHLLISINEAAMEGLNPSNYHAEKLNELVAFASPNQPKPDKYQLDVLLTDAALRYAWHLDRGKTDPSILPYRWDIDRAPANIPARLHEALSQGTFSSFFDKLKPQHSQYTQLKFALEDYRQKEMNGIVYTTIPEGASLKPGMKDDRVALLRQRLADEYFMPATQNNDVRPSTDSVRLKTQTNPVDSFYNEKMYDKQLVQVVKLFQQHHGLEPDGAVGKQTLQILNESIPDRINQILLTLDKWRWLPNYLGDRYLLVNIPSYLIRAYENNYAMLTKRVVVGAISTPTPIFSEQMQYIEFNPNWGVPYSIATKEILPKLKRNSGYLKSHNMELFSGGKKINPSKVNWSNVSARNFYYNIRQMPGSNNALGVVKFLFPNQYDVYLHDTPSKSLFANAQRAYSHGCIRLEKPLELAEYLLKPDFSPEKIADLVDKGKNKRVFIPQPLPIYLLYLTVWVDESSGQTYFYPDIYNRDKSLLRFFEH